jgi:ubiquinone/menaquinone biosynthesis C-methylase UbiE
VSTKDAQAKAAFAYNAAADSYDDPANSFWARFGRRTVERLHLPPGAHVLDVCCGTGASAIPAAQAVGPTGYVLGVDLAEKLLEHARAKAAAQSLNHFECCIGDMLELHTTPASFDAVICVFGIFFVPDMRAAVNELWRMLRPGGQLAITTWGPRFFEPASSMFWDAVRDVRPDLHRGFNPWDRVSDPAGVRAIFPEDEDVETLEVVAEAGTHPLRTPEDFWAAALGSGYRGTIERLDADARTQVRDRTLHAIQRAGIREIEANVVFAVAHKRRQAA